MADRKTIQYYDRHAASYGSVAPHGNFVTYREKFIRMLAPKSKVLDLGCGGGHASVAFLEQGFDVLALDGSAELANIASQRIGTNVVVKDFFELDYHGEFDGIWAAASLTHVPMSDLKTVLQLVCSAIRGKGVLVASFKCADEDWRDVHGRLFGATTPETLRNVAESAGFNVDHIDLVAGRGRTNESRTWAWMIAKPNSH
jgi:2-polyprenyl-3-methyl-5-hydroxy-6-metoxy-1,4-benzoquinol methylase